jgi:predicted nucleic-acid-binding Zn-ribbon protein
MKDGICPKCEAKDVHVYSSSTEVSVKLSIFGSAGVGYYICTNCGYVELFIENKEDLPKIAEKYPKVY